MGKGEKDDFGTFLATVSEADVGNLINQVMKQLGEEGRQLTAQQESLVQLTAKTMQHSSVDEILTAVKKVLKLSPRTNS